MMRTARFPTLHSAVTTRDLKWTSFQYLQPDVPEQWGYMSRWGHGGSLYSEVKCIVGNAPTPLKVRTSGG